MLGEDPVSIEAYSTYMDYVKVWTKTNDRWGPMHVSLDTFCCFKAIETVTYDLIKKGSTKEEVMSQVQITKGKDLYLNSDRATQIQLSMVGYLHYLKFLMDLLKSILDNTDQEF